MNRNHFFYALTATAFFAACAESGAGFGETDETNDDTTSAGGSLGTGGDPTTGSTTGSGAGTTSGTTGSGGDMTTSGTTSSSSTGGGGACAHDVCTTGVALVIGCGDPCVDTVCNADGYCCDAMGGEWDEVCVEEAVDLCSASCTLPISYGDLVITEIMNNPTQVADPGGEWFELYNDSGSAIDLLGFQIAHQANDPNAVETISQSIVLQPGDYVVLGYDANMSTNGNVPVDYQYSTSVSLNNGADYLAILDSASNPIDDVWYDEASGLDPSGATRTLDPLFLTAYDNDDDLYFCAATSTMSGGTDLGTPGAPNDSCPP